MSALTISLVLTAACLHAVWNIVAKGVRGNGSLFVWWYGLVSAVIFIPLSFLEHGSLSAWGWPLFGAAIASGLLHTFYGVALQTGYERAPLGIVYPVARGVGPMLTMIVAVSLLGEKLKITGVAGAIAVLLGVLVVATLGRPTSSKTPGSPSTPMDGGARTGDLTDTPEAQGDGVESVSADVEIHNEVAQPHHGGAAAGVIWGLIVGASIAGYTLWDDHSMTGIHLPPVTYFALSSAFVSVILAPKALANRAEVATSWNLDKWRIITVGLMSPMAYILVLFAMQKAPVALVAPMRESSIVVGSLLAWVLYRENNLIPRLFGIAIVLSGIVLISA